MSSTTAPTPTANASTGQFMPASQSSSHAYAAALALGPAAPWSSAAYAEITAAHRPRPLHPKPAKSWRSMFFMRPAKQKTEAEAAAEKLDNGDDDDAA